MMKTRNLDAVLKDFLPILELQCELAEGYPVRIGDKYGLTEGGELSDEDEAKAKQEWKDVYNRIIFLIKELDEETCTSPLAKNVNDLLDMRIKETRKNELYVDEHHDLSDELRTAYSKLCDEYDEARNKLDDYLDKCKDELFDLLKTWWWDLLSY